MEGLHALLPDAGMALGVNAADHFDAVAFQDEEHLVRKPSGEDAPHVLVEHPVVRGFSAMVSQMSSTS